LTNDIDIHSEKYKRCSTLCSQARLTNTNTNNSSQLDSHNFSTTKQTKWSLGNIKPNKTTTNHPSVISRVKQGLKRICSAKDKKHNPIKIQNATFAKSTIVSFVPHLKVFASYHIICERHCRMGGKRQANAQKMKILQTLGTVT